MQSKSFQHQFLQPWNQTCQKVHKIITRRTYGSSLGNTAHMAAFMSKKGSCNMLKGLHGLRWSWHDQASLVKWVTHCDLPIIFQVLQAHLIENERNHFSMGSRWHWHGSGRRKDRISRDMLQFFHSYSFNLPLSFPYDIIVPHFSLMFFYLFHI